MYLCERERERLGECVCGVEGDLKPVWFVPAGVSGLDSWAVMGSLKKPPLRTSHWRTHSIIMSLEIYHLDGSPVFLPHFK